MVRRLVSLVLLLWILGFIVFAIALPRPAGDERTAGIAVLTGGAGRIDRGLEALRMGWAHELLVSGVDTDVKPHEFAVEYRIGSAQMACCVTLGFSATDTRSNARETADWMAARKLKSVRLVTSDWHMRRAVLELRREVPAGTEIIEDAVPTHPTFKMLFLEYHKLLARAVAGALGA